MVEIIQQVIRIILSKPECVDREECVLLENAYNNSNFTCEEG